jgi:hypothetical protein
MSVSTLRPNATVSSTGVAAPSGSASSVTSDNSDSTRFEPVGASGVLRAVLDFGTVTLAAGEIVARVTPRIRGREYVYPGTSGFSSACQVTVIDGGPVVTSTVSGFGLSLSTQAGPPRLRTLDQAALDGIRLEVVSQPVPFAPIEIAEIYLDVTRVPRPTVSVLSPAGSTWTTSSFIPFAWSPSIDIDGGGVTHYELKAWHGGTPASFDTTPAQWESGVVASSSNSATIGPIPAISTVSKALTVGLRVAQTVNGQLHWSPWTSKAFTSFNPPVVIISSVTPTAVNASGAVNVDVRRSTAGGSAAWNFVEVERSTDGGASWQPVRGGTIVPPDTATRKDVLDRDIAPGVAARYRARGIWIDAGNPSFGAWVQSAGTMSWTPSPDCAVWLKSPNTPALNRVVPLAPDGFSGSRPRRQGVFDVLSAGAGSATSVVVSDAWSGWRGTIDLATRRGDADLSALLAEPVLLLHAPPSWGIPAIYVAPGQIDRQFSRFRADTREGWSIAFVEVAAPPDPLAGSV